VLLIVAMLGLSQILRAADPLPQRSYDWLAEVVQADPQARTVTLKARIPDYVVKYVDRYSAGERLVLVWNMIGKKQSDTVLALWKFDDGKDANGGHTGFVLPIELVSADAQQRTVTFNAQVREAVLTKLKSAKAGQWIKATSPMAQPSLEANITAVDFTEAPPPPEPPATHKG
jgi:hypothetical protein